MAVIKPLNMTKYTHKSFVTAVQYDGTPQSVERIMDAFGTKGFNNSEDGLHMIDNDGGHWAIKSGDYISDLYGEPAPITKESFERMYEPVASEPARKTHEQIRIEALYFCSKDEMRLLKERVFTTITKLKDNPAITPYVSQALLDDLHCINALLSRLNIIDKSMYGVFVCYMDSVDNKIEESLA